MYDFRVDKVREVKVYHLDIKNIIKTRTLESPTTFKTADDYIYSFQRLTIEHLQVLVTEKAEKFHDLFTPNANSMTYRTKDVGMHEGHIKRVYMTDGPSPSNECVCVLSVDDKEASSKYSKGDLWIVSDRPDFSSSMICQSRSVIDLF